MPAPPPFVRPLSYEVTKSSKYRRISLTFSFCVTCTGAGKKGEGGHSFSRSKYFHLLIAPIKGFITQLDNEIDRKIDVTAILFLLVYRMDNKHMTEP